MNTINTRKISVKEIQRDELRNTFVTHVGMYQNLYEVKVHRREFKNSTPPLVEVWYNNSKLYDWLSDGQNFDQLNYELGEVSRDALALSGNEKRCSLFNCYYVVSFFILKSANPSYIDGFDWLMARLFSD